MLLDNWDKVSQLREKSGDTSLNTITDFWALSEQSLPVQVNVHDGTVRDMAGFNDVWFALILKR